MCLKIVLLFCLSIASALQSPLIIYDDLFYYLLFAILLFNELNPAESSKI